MRWLPIRAGACISRTRSASSGTHRGCPRLGPARGRPRTPTRSTSVPEIRGFSGWVSASCRNRRAASPSPRIVRLSSSRHPTGSTASPLRRSPSTRRIRTRILTVGTMTGCVSDGWRRDLGSRPPRRASASRSRSILEAPGVVYEGVAGGVQKSSDAGETLGGGEHGTAEPIRCVRALLDLAGSAGRPSRRHRGRRLSHRRRGSELGGARNERSRPSSTPSRGIRPRRPSGRARRTASIARRTKA